MNDLRDAARQALDYINEVDYGPYDDRSVKEALRAALKQPQRTLTDEKIAELWHKNGGFHHHFARAVERWLKGEK
jgi:hypothetical protein